MRILRGKSSREVSYNGFALFVIGLVLATFVGGAIRTLLRSDQIHQRVLTELRTRFPKHEFQVGQTEVLLSRGLWPALALKVKDLVFKQDACGKLSFVLEVPEAILPVDLLSLWRSQPRLRQVAIHGGHIHLNYRECAPRLESIVKLNSLNPILIKSQRAIKPPRLDWQALGRQLDGLLLTNFTVTYERNVTWKLDVALAEISFGDELYYHANLNLQKSLPFGALTHLVELEGRGSGRVLSWDLSSDFKEGLIAWSGSWDLVSNAARTSLQMKQLPMKDFLLELHQMGFVPNEINLKAAWLSSDLEWEGKLESYKDFPIKIQALHFLGGYGRVDLLEPVAMDLNQGQNFFKNPAVLKASQLQLQPIAEALEWRLMPSIISRTGVWTGTFRFHGPHDWALDGFLENLEVVFSHLSVRGKQLIRRIHTVARSVGADVKAKIDEMSIQDGEFLGVVSLSWDRSSKKGSVSAQIERLALSRLIQDLLVGGRIAAVKLGGQGSFTEKGLQSWEAEAQVAEVEGAGWRGENLSLKSRQSGSSVIMDIRVQAGRVDDKLPFSEQVRSIQPYESELEWKEGVASLIVDRAGGQIQSLSAIETTHEAQWRGRGTWVRDGDFSGVLHVKKAERTQSFALRGNSGGLQVDGGTALSR